MNARQWLEWTPANRSPHGNATDETDKTPSVEGFVGFVSSVFRPKTNSDGERLDLDEALALLRRAHAEIAQEYIEGAVGWAFADADLKARLRVAEGCIERLAGTEGGPLRFDWVPAVGALTTLWREILARYRQQRKVA